MYATMLDKQPGYYYRLLAFFFIDVVFDAESGSEIRFSRSHQRVEL